jgi:hypothetical protein
MPTDEYGVAAFTLSPGTYVVSAGDAVREATVVAWTGTVPLALEV